MVDFSSRSKYGWSCPATYSIGTENRGPPSNQKVSRMIFAVARGLAKGMKKTTGGKSFQPAFGG
ncbi:hypothetical protein KY290_018318 [Solanum tuberosum]|uniref:Uncharacterized protein n=1 Tax=Solanum tuberosum TaxID=4113 RepID=A0ABQ7VDU9_SOLTU|nr:hypothetical protein KY290_018318 [Solanum tuberosum]